MKIFLFLICITYVVNAEIDLQNAEIPDIDFDDFSAIKEKCDRLGGNGTYEALKAAKEPLQSCIQGFVDVAVLKNEIEEAKKTGSLDEVFGKYCRKRPKLASCVQNFTESLRPCLNDDEKKALNTTLDIMRQLGDFACFRDGDRIAIFIAEGGVECIQSHSQGIQDCVKSTFNASSVLNSNALPNLLMDKKKCDDLGKLQICVVEELEKCSESTPANIVDALINFIKRSACAKKNKRSVSLHRIIKRSVSITETLYSTPEAKAELIKIIEEKCDEHNPKRGIEALQKALHNAKVCLDSKQSLLNGPPQQLKQGVRDCVEELIKAAGNCLPNDEKYLPEFLYNISSNLVDFVYSHKDMLTRASHPEMTSCFQILKQEAVKNKIQSCIKLPEQVEQGNLSKQSVCGYLFQIRKCVSEEIENRCIRDIAISKLVDAYFEANTRACKQN